MQLPARSAQSRNPLRACLIKLCRVRDLKNQRMMPQPKETIEELRNKVIDISQSGKGYKAISKALGL